MLKRNKGKLVLSSLIILLPALAGVLLWRVLPEQMTVHWGAGGTADGTGSRLFAVVGLPLLMLAMHWLCILMTAMDPKNRNQSDKAFGIVLWIAPVASLLSGAVLYAAALGVEPRMDQLLPVGIGLMFVLIGNVLPKCRQNYTLGIKVKWALENEENWNATHRFGGKVWVACGFIIMAGTLWPSGQEIVLLTGVLLAAVAPIVYSYFYARKQRKVGKAVFTPLPRMRAGVSMAVIALVLALAAVLCFSGDVTVEYGPDAAVIRASYRPDADIRYAQIESIEYREERVPGQRKNGLGSPRLLLGTFTNEEFGSYTRYTYTGCEASVVLRVDGRTVVVSGRDEEETRAIYEALRARMP